MPPKRVAKRRPQSPASCARTMKRPVSPPRGRAWGLAAHPICIDDGGRANHLSNFPPIAEKATEQCGTVHFDAGKWLASYPSPLILFPLPDSLPSLFFCVCVILVVAPALAHGNRSHVSDVLSSSGCFRVRYVPLFRLSFFFFTFLSALVPK